MSNYDASVRCIQELIQAERSFAGDLGLTRLLVHGHATENAILCLHGFTNSPQQLAAFGEQVYKLGWNVLIPRLPHHGLADRLTRDLKNLDAAELVEFADRALGVVHGLGAHITVLGFSLGGLLAVLLAQYRSDVDLVVSIAPNLGMAMIPHPLARVISRLLRALPDFYIWWDPRTKAANPCAYPFAYPGFSSHGLAELIRMGIIARRYVDKLSARRVILVSNGADAAVSNAEIRRAAAIWSAHASGGVSTYEFERACRFPHDMMTPESPGTRVDIIYPKLIELILTGQPKRDEGERKEGAP